jgi:hypothetical protein
MEGIANGGTVDGIRSVIDGLANWVDLNPACTGIVDRCFRLSGYQIPWYK